MKKLIYFLILIPLFVKAQAPTSDSTKLTPSTSFTPSSWYYKGPNGSNMQVGYLNTITGKWVQMVTGYQFNNYTGASTQAQINALISSGAVTVATVSALQSISSSATTAILTDSLRGKVNPIFNYYPSSTATIDNGVVFAATGKGWGRWVRQYNNGPVYPEWWGGVSYRTAFQTSPIDSRAALQAAADFKPTRNTRVNIEGIFYSSGDIKVGQATAFEGLATSLWPTQFFSATDSVNYRIQSAVKFNGNSNGFVTDTTGVINYRSQGITFRNLAILGGNRSQGKTGFVSHQTVNSTSFSKTTGLGHLENVYFSGWNIGADGTASTDSWYITNCHFSDVNYGVIGGSGQTFISFSDFFNIASTAMILNSNDGDIVSGGEIEPRFSADYAIVINGKKTQILGNQIFQTRKAIKVTSTAQDVQIKTNYFDSAADDNITSDGAIGVNISGNHFIISGITGSTDINFTPVTQNLNYRMVYARNTTGLIMTDNYMHKILSTYTGTPAKIDTCYSYMDNNMLLGTFSFTDDRAFAITSGSVQSKADYGIRYLGADIIPITAGARNLGDATHDFLNIYGRSFLSQSGNAAIFGAIGTNSVFLTSGGTSRWQLTSGGIWQPVADNTYNLGGTANRIATGYFTNVQVGLTGLLKGNGAGSNVTAAVANTDYLPVASPAMTGTPTAPTAAAITNSTQLATTAFVKAQGYGVNPMTTLGDIIYGGASGVPARLAGETSTTRKFLSSVGAAGIATAPTFYDLYGTNATWGGIPTFSNGIQTGSASSLLGGNLQLNYTVPISWLNSNTVAQNWSASQDDNASNSRLRFIRQGDGAGFYSLGNQLYDNNNVAYLKTTDGRIANLVSASVTMVLNNDYLNTTATQYTLTLPTCGLFTADGSKIITVLATGTGGAIIRVPSGYAMQSGTNFATTTGTGGTTLTQGQKIQLIPIGTNSYYLQPLNGAITLY